MAVLLFIVEFIARLILTYLISGLIILFGNWFLKLIFPSISMMEFWQAGIIGFWLLFFVSFFLVIFGENFKK